MTQKKINRIYHVMGNTSRGGVVIDTFSSRDLAEKYIEKLKETSSKDFFYSFYVEGTELDPSI